MTIDESLIEHLIEEARARVTLARVAGKKPPPGDLLLLGIAWIDQRAERRTGRVVHAENSHKISTVAVPVVAGGSVAAAILAIGKVLEVLLQ